MLVNRDVQKWPPPGPGKEPQSTVAHELAHTLGQLHSNESDPRCRHNNSICYGAPGTKQRRNLMGAGNVIDVTNAEPWLNSIWSHTPHLVWSATDQQPMETHFLR